MQPRLRFWIRARDWLLVVVAVAVLAILYSHWRGEQAPPPVRLTITAGRLGSERGRLLRALVAECRLRGLYLDVVETRGSEDALLVLAEPGSRLDLALVQGGLEVEADHHARLRQVMSLQDEGLHLIVRGEELARRVEADGLDVLRGRSIAVGVDGSGTARMAREVLSFAGLTRDDYEERTLDASDLVEMPADQLPDASFQVALLPARAITRLVDERGYRLVSLPFADAFMLWRPPPRVYKGVIHRNVRSMVIPALTYDRDPPVPDRPLTTLSTRTLLVARADLSSDVVERLLEVVLESPFARYDEPPLEVSRLWDVPELDWHPGAVAFRNRNRPLIAEEFLDLLEKEFSIAGAVLGAGFVIWQWIQKRIRRVRDEGFDHYMHKVAEIERAALDLGSSAEPNMPRLIQLQQELARLKTEAVERLVASETESVEFLTAFLMQINDARENLNGLMIRHSRETLEAQALPEERPIQVGWSNAAVRTHGEGRSAGSAGAEPPDAGFLAS
ncbi:MAG: hypothetical protein KatS3mg108_3563 [Isosphaeraceae bacterium]|jgi:TRAP transporter TAXI family solute receptor|nr:MAG: hypothetical protein KatS3mg108_3563 [Isosphaeraceae bacterium]